MISRRSQIGQSAIALVVGRLLSVVIFVPRGFCQAANSVEQASAGCLELLELFSLAVDFVTQFIDGLILVRNSCLEVDKSLFGRHVESPFIKMIGGGVNRSVIILMYSLG
jgi:hypothetical protein